MAYQDHYGMYLEQLKEKVETAQKSPKTLVFGYTSNYDVVLQWDVKAYNEILRKYLKEEPRMEEGDVIDSMESFARITSDYLIKGLGGSIDVTELKVCQTLNEIFQGEGALGGTCAQGAAALGSLGIPVVTCLTDWSGEVCSLLDNPGTSAVKGDKIVPISECVSLEDAVFHLILQFQKGDKLEIHGKTYEIPVSNRLILFYDTIHKYVRISEDFLNYWDTRADKVSAYLASGFDAIIDMEVIRERMAQLAPHLAILKKENPQAILYFEGAYYMNNNVKEYLCEKIAPYADIFGMNEEELEVQMQKEGKEFSKNSLPSVLEALRVLLKKYPIQGIVLHTKDYAMYFGRELPGIDMEQGLTIGNLMSGTRARLGKYGTLEELEESRGCMELSKDGLAFAAELEELAPPEYVRLVPSRYLENPKYTIGLGDTFVAGVHTCFIR
ncbi:MAG TPA: hypothetical protein IAB98_00305 [Candidatus Egerieimonas intestinavium]|uniref:ADP-dependent phosphofructokinase/glucokinase n=1 Tax=Candidatus Egerieimonas intestinavium TaxID=2840777 RepID=A0A9D1EH72_9FIRM|nr:hypothetical protein [Candidatus Egerieimonas intestinavium]